MWEFTGFQQPILTFQFEMKSVSTLEYTAVLDTVIVFTIFTLLQEGKMICQLFMTDQLV
jgi:hypothetical protein